MNKKGNHHLIEEKEIYRHDFVIYQMPRELSCLKKNTKSFNRAKFISPVFGMSVIDKPIQIRTKGSSDIASYDAFRTEENKILKDDELIKKHGTKFHEFQVVSSTPRKNNVVDPELLQNTAIIQEQVRKKDDEVITKTEVSYDDYRSIFKKGEAQINKMQNDDKELEDINYNDDQIEPAIIVGTRNKESDSFFENPYVDDIEESFDDRINYDDINFGKSKQEKKEINFFQDTKTTSIAHSNYYEEVKLERETNYRDNKMVSPSKVNYRTYELPPISLLKSNPKKTGEEPYWIEERIETINATLLNFDIEGSVCGYSIGPSVTRYEIKLAPGVKVQKINSLEKDLQMSLSATSIRLETPIPGKSTVGIEVPNTVVETVYFRTILEANHFLEDEKKLTVALGLDIDGKAIYSDIGKMPHGLVAGASGSGKSVCMNTILISLLMKNRPDELKFILIDPKQVEFTAYDDLPHLITPVISDAKTASMALKWCVDEMERRYLLMRDYRVRDLKSYNEKADNEDVEKLPYIIIVIDELADLMMAASQDVEDSIKRITQKARAAGMHLIVATQRPDTNVLNGSIKANIPYRIGFKVATSVDSSVILDRVGAEKLLGRGDMLIREVDDLKRLQGAYLSDNEIDACTNFIRCQCGPNYLFSHDILQKETKRQEEIGEIDDLLEDVARYVVEEDTCSLNNIQMQFSLGWPRAKTLVQTLESLGVVSEKTGSTKGREILVNMDELEEILSNLR